MLIENEAIAKEVEQVMIDIYSTMGIEYKTYVTSINSQGVKIISSE